LDDDYSLIDPSRSSLFGQFLILQCSLLLAGHFASRHCDLIITEHVYLGSQLWHGTDHCASCRQSHQRRTTTIH